MQQYLSSSVWSEEAVPPQNVGIEEAYNVAQAERELDKALTSRQSRLQIVLIIPQMYVLCPQ